MFRDNLQRQSPNISCPSSLVLPASLTACPSLEHLLSTNSRGRHLERRLLGIPTRVDPHSFGVVGTPLSTNPGPPTRAETQKEQVDQGKMALLLLLVHLFLALVGASPIAPPGGPGKFSVKTTRNQHYNPNGLAQYAKALSKWGGDIPKGLASHVSNKGQGRVCLAVICRRFIADT